MTKKRSEGLSEEQITRILDRIEQLGFSGTAVSEAAGFNRGFISDLKKRKAVSIGIDGLRALCKVLGMSVAELLDGHVKPPLRVPIIGETTYSDAWRQYTPSKTLPDIIDLWTTNDDLIAVRVVENSMAPRYQRGDVVMGNRIIGGNADNYIGLHCIVKTVDNQTYVKVITRGSEPNHYTLRSLDPSAEDIENVLLSWFAPIVSIMPQSH